MWTFFFLLRNNKSNGGTAKVTLVGKLESATVLSLTPALLRASAPRDGRLCSLPVVSPSHVTRLLLLRTRLNSVTCHAWGHSHHELPVALPPGKDRACFLWGRNPNGARARPGWFDSSFLLRAGVPLLHPLPPLETIPPVPPSALLSFFPTLHCRGTGLRVK